MYSVNEWLDLPDALHAVMLQTQGVRLAPSIGGNVGGVAEWASRNRTFCGAAAELIATPKNFNFRSAS